MTEKTIRYLPELELPSYSYVPGLEVHPNSHPDGHGCPGPRVSAACEAIEFQWTRCELYLWGFDLFNHGYHWEAHEAWEEVWIAVGRKGVTGDFLKGLIKLAAGAVKLKEGIPAGVKRHANRAIELFQQVGQDHSHFAGCRIGLLREHANALSELAEVSLHQDAVGSIRPLPFVLILEPFERKSG